jgi:uncharacterized protein (TIGR03435 family)
VGCYVAPAQPAAGPSFSVASFKLLTGPCSAAAPCNFEEFHITPTGVEVHGCVLGYLVRWAYGLHIHQPHEVTGPDWLEPGGDWVRYDVAAKTDEPVSNADLRLMMRTLLAERLKLRVHREPKEMPVYVLAVAGGSPKLHPSEGEGESRFIPPPRGADGGWWWGGDWRFEHYRLSDLYDFLWRFVPIPIVDETGIQGQYDIVLDIPKYQDLYQIPTEGNRADFGPVLKRAFADIGLKFELKRRPVEILVIDHVDRTPVDN